jgi:hypothetical protein
MSDYKDIFANLLVKTHFTEEKDEREYDYEGDMAKSQLKSIITNAQKLHDMLDDSTNLPEWVQSKITLAEDYVLTAANYMEGELDEEYEMYEAHMTDAQMKRREELVKGMKSADWEKRYPGRGEKVMYATATKMAMKEDLDEEVEQIDELKKSTLQSYAKKASKEMKKAYDYHQMRYGGRDGSDPEYMKKTYPWALAKMDRREAGVAKAKQKLAKEEVEQIDELKKSTLASYVNKAANQVRAKTGIAASFETSGSRKRDPENKAAYMDLAKDYRKGAKKRLGGIEKATAKLAKEEVETVEEGAADWKKAFDKKSKSNLQKDTWGMKLSSKSALIPKSHFDNEVDVRRAVSQIKREKTIKVDEEVRYFSGTTVSGKPWKFIPPGEPKMLSPEFVKDRVPTLTDKEAHEVSVVAKDQYNDVEKKFAEMSEAKGGTVPKTAKEKALAAKAHPKHLITRKDVLHARGVKLGEEELREKMREKMFAGKTMTKKQADPVVFHPMGKKKQPQK